MSAKTDLFVAPTSEIEMRRLVRRGERGQFWIMSRICVTKRVQLVGVSLTCWRRSSRLRVFERSNFAGGVLSSETGRLPLPEGRW